MRNRLEDKIKIGDLVVLEKNIFGIVCAKNINGIYRVVWAGKDREYLESEITIKRLKKDVAELMKGVV